MHLALFVLLLDLATCLPMGKTIGAAAYTALHQPFGMITLKTCLVLLCCLVLVVVDVLWSLSMVSWYRGKPSGLIAAIGTLSTVLYSVFASSLWLQDVRPTQQRYAYAFIVPVVLILGALLLSKPAREYSALAAWPRRSIVLAGAAWGTAATVVYAGAILSMLRLAHWLKG